MTHTPSFEDRDGFIWLDGKIVDWRDARVHVLTHALHYGSAVFEGERSYNGKIFKLDAHNDRLWRSASIMDMAIPYTKDELVAARLEVIKVNNLKDCYLRPLVWRGPETTGIAAQNTKIHVMVAAWEWANYFDPEKTAKGLALKTAKWKRPMPESAPVQAKASGGYMIGTLARHEAMAAGFDDALMLDVKDRVAEATGANLFAIKKGVLTTPPTECSLNGITRLSVIDLARSLGLTVEERFFGYDDLMQADEIFLTGTAAEIQGVSKIDDKVFGVGPITKQLQGEYGLLVRR